ncbi:MAG: SDR family NAD(P)-dependent oxidoreductase [Alphaproteobacteria bacterium]|nr:SDR family NAD(P)-dependent oxidoreductase [Alphaproteobacteria bacterium]
MPLLCFGYGFSARAARRLLRPTGIAVAATYRRSGDEIGLLQEEVEPIALARLESPEFNLNSYPYLLISAPPLPTTGEDAAVLARHSDPILAVLELRERDRTLSLHPESRIFYLSTTGVYGDHRQAWVDETTLAAPTTERGMRRLAAEQGWSEFAHRHSLQLSILRLAGIYGLGRSVLDTIRAGKAQRIHKEGQVFSRIHVEDIGLVIATLMARPFAAGVRVFNLCDDRPCPPAEVVEYGCQLLGVAPPPLREFAEVAASLSPMAASFYSESKRVSNHRLKAEILPQLQFPDYRLGLDAIFAAEQPVPSSRD